jgi:methionyl-tRNA synthetase
MPGLKVPSGYAGRADAGPLEGGRMLIRKFERAQLESEPNKVLFKDLYPWDAIADTPFGASLAVVEGGGSTMLHSHYPAECFFIFSGRGTMTCNGEAGAVSQGDVVYLPPGSHHTLKNDSESEALMFLSLFWNEETEDETPEAVAAPQPRLVFPSPPTPNGPLHLGHLSGPYLAADVVRRFDRMRGLGSKMVMLTDDHQSYTVLKAEYEESTPAETAEKYANQAVELMKAFDAAPDAWLFPSRDEEYRTAVREAFAQLLDAGYVELRETDALFCESCQQYLMDGRAVGDCPYCGTTCRGFLCETCCMPNKTVDLNDAGCLDCDSDAVKKPLTQVWFSL